MRQPEKAVVLLSNDLSHPALSKQQDAFSWRINRLRPLIKRGRVVIVVAAGGAVGRGGRPTLANFGHPVRNDGRIVLISPPILRIPMLWLVQSMIITPLMVLLYCRRNRIEVEAVIAASVPYGAVGKALNMLLRTVLIVDYGDPDFARERSVALRVLLFLEAFVLGSEDVDAVTCIDPNISRYVVRYGPKRVVFLPPGGFWNDALPETVVSRELEDRKIVYTGHVAPPPAYRLDLLIDAAPKVVARTPGARIVVVGDGGYLPTLRRRASQLRLGDSLETTGAVPYERAKAEVAGAEVALQLLNDMCLGTKVIDYFAMGKAVVACGKFYDSYTEFLRNGENCLLVPPSSEELADAITLLLNDGDMRERLGRNALETVRGYDWESQAEVLLGLIAEGHRRRTS